MAEKGNNRSFKSPQMGQPGWIQGRPFLQPFRRSPKNVRSVCPEQHPSQCVSGSTRTVSVLSVNLSFFLWLKSHKCLVPIVWELILDIVPVAQPTSSQ